MEKICDYTKCTACRACEHICPKNAIKLQENEYGFLLPVVDNSKCINCGLCQRICQVNNSEELRYPGKCYAVWTKNDNDRINCTSGGVSTGFGRSVIKDGGIVFGAAYNDNFELKIIDTECEQGLENFIGSKYVQCDTADSYKKVYEHLKNGKKVLYTGTPCQVMGLRKYLKKDYDNLVTVDIICHGVPPFRYLKDYVKYTCPDNHNAKVFFRGKNDYKLTIYNKDELVYSKERFKDKYFTAFANGLCFRDNCYTCSYARAERSSDITIGDFWGLNRNTLKQSYSGRISAVLINTEKGQSFFDKVSDNFFYEERTVEEAVQGNGQLQKPTRLHPKRDIFLKTYKKEGIIKAFNKAGIFKIMLEKRLVNNRWYYKVKKLFK